MGVRADTVPAPSPTFPRLRKGGSNALAAAQKWLWKFDVGFMLSN